MKWNDDLWGVKTGLPCLLLPRLLRGQEQSFPAPQSGLARPPVQPSLATCMAVHSMRLIYLRTKGEVARCPFVLSSANSHFFLRETTLALYTSGHSFDPIHIYIFFSSLLFFFSFLSQSALEKQSKERSCYAEGVREVRVSRPTIFLGHVQISLSHCSSATDTISLHCRRSSSVNRIQFN